MHFLVQVSTNLEQDISCWRNGGRVGGERSEKRNVLVEHVGDHLDLGFCCGDLLC